MAGLYPDAPAPRLAYDIDGTVVGKIVGGVITLATASNLSNIQDESDIYWGGTQFSTDQPIAAQGNTASLFFIFPYLTDVTGICIIQPGTGNLAGVNMTVETSVDTTTGQDGTWTNRGTIQSPNVSVNPNYRSSISAIAGATAVRAIRITVTVATAKTFNPSCVHLYGKPAAASNRLEFWHPTLDQSLFQTPAYFDFGDVPRGSAAIVKSYRLKNRSTTLTATGITVSTSVLTEQSPTIASQVQHRYDGGAYGATASLASLGPQAVSQVFDAKLTPSATAALGLGAERFKAVAGAWS